MGEIGISRHEFLYDMQWWEINSVIRGYRRRNRFTQQLIAENIYTTMHVMRDPKGKSVEDLFPSLFNHDDDNDMPPISDEEVEDLQADIAAYNADNSKP